MTNTPWKPSISMIADGESVNAEVANRPLQQVEQRSRHLKEKVESLSSLSGRLVMTSATTKDDVAVGSFVYFDTQAREFRLAMGDIEQNPLTGSMEAAAGARAVGIVISKASSTIGDVLLAGRVNVTDLGLSIADLLDDPASEFVSGPLYLSVKIPGKAVPTRVFPSIQLGFFSVQESFICVNHKDLFESHEHFRFSLLAKPSASQNYAQTGWTSFGLSGSGVNKRVDYYNEGGSATPPAILLCVRQNTGDAISEDDPVRVEIYNDGGLKIDLHSGSLDYEDPASVADTVTSIAVQPWPAYGAWVAVDGTNLEIAFIRSDDTYNNSLSDDADSLLDSTDKRFKVFLPTDLTGWTNANPFDLSFVDGALFRYLLDSDSVLTASFPPLPVESAIIQLNGVDLSSTTDFAVTHLGIFWKIATFDAGDVAPWPADYSADSGVTQVLDNAKTLVLSYIRSGLNGMNSVVFSLTGISPIVVSRCPDASSAKNGHLQVGIDLSLTTSTDDPGNAESTLASVSGVNFTKSYLVSELEAGPGIRLENITPSATAPSKNVGKVRVSSSGLKFEGEMSSIVLRNAKEMAAAFGSYIDFVPPSQAASGITGSFKLPNEDFNPATIKLYVLAQFRGDTDVPSSSSELFAMFRVRYHVMRPGFVMSAMSAANAIATQYWRIPFAAGYQATAILSREYPYLAGTDDEFEINPTTLVDNPSSLVALSGGFLAGDRVAVIIDRVTEDEDSNVANYQGRVGMSGLRWYLK